ncbi:BSD domain protein [Cooperia oncophora]
MDEKLLELQSNEDTFCKEPENSEGYSKWVARFNIEEYDAEINVLLANNPTLREIYSKLGNLLHYDVLRFLRKVDSEVFWSRYFFAVEIAEMDEELRNSFSLKELTIKTGADGKKQKKGSGKEGGDSPGSDGSIAVVDQQPTSPAASADDWSVCSEKNYVEGKENKLGMLYYKISRSAKDQEVTQNAIVGVLPSCSLQDLNDNVLH